MNEVDGGGLGHDGAVLRVAYTVEQCWHAVPGGTASATLEVARRLIGHSEVDVVPVAGRHRRRPPAAYRPPGTVRQLPLARPWLYETWNRFEWPRVEQATGAVDVCHSTTAIPAATGAPHVVTIHDVAFIETPDRFTRHGVRVMRRGLERCRRADLVLCPSQVTRTALQSIDFDGDRIRVVPWGVEAHEVTPEDRARVRAQYELPSEFVLFVGTVEPRKNLHGLARAAARADLPLVAAGPQGWGSPSDVDSVRFLGFVEPTDLPALYTSATVMAYPSFAEGFGLPVAEAMAYGTPVVTSRGTATEEVAGGAAVLVDPHDVDSIARGLIEAAADAERRSELGLARAASLSWEATAAATVAAYREVAS